MKNEEIVIGFAFLKDKFLIYVFGLKRNGINYKDMKIQLVLLLLVMKNKVQSFLFLDRRIKLSGFGILKKKLSIFVSN